MVCNFRSPRKKSGRKGDNKKCECGWEETNESCEELRSICDVFYSRRWREGGFLAVSYR